MRLKPKRHGRRKKKRLMWILNTAEKDCEWLFKMHNAKDLTYTRMNDKKIWTKKQIFMGIPNS